MNYFTPEKLIGMNEIGKVSLMFFKKDCMDCHACEVACKQENGLGVGPRLVRVI
jgi:Fe-S-cluster-containing dehydrogenase component